MIEFKTGKMSKKALEVFLNTVPIGITFSDENDIIQYYNNPKDDIFPRTKDILGTTVKSCHPEKSHPIVDKLLDQLRSGDKDEVEAWYPDGNKFIHIRFLSLRDDDGKYIGCVELVQDISQLKLLKGERRSAESI